MKSLDVQESEQSTEAGSFVRVVTLVTAYAGHIAVGAFLGIVIVAGVLLVMPRSYTAEVVFLPEEGAEATSGVAGLAAQFGLAFGATGSATPEFYADLVRSWSIVNEVAWSEYAVADWRAGILNRTPRDTSGVLATLLQIESADQHRLRDKIVHRLRSRISTMVDREAGTVTIRVSMPWATLARDAAARLVSIVDSFDVHIRNTRASVERRFVETRLADAEDSLRSVEADLTSFLARNRVFSGSPTLSFEHDRLVRRTNEKQAVVSTLRQALEQARIEEVRSTPVLTIVEPPRVPGLRDRRYLIARGLMGAILGGLVGLMVAVFGAFLSTPPERLDDDLRVLQSMLRRMAWWRARPLRRRTPGKGSAM